MKETGVEERRKGGKVEGGKAESKKGGREERNVEEMERKVGKKAL